VSFRLNFNENIFSVLFSLCKDPFIQNANPNAISVFWYT